jgi:bifunctional UDP-N-acetylglucosamine pyrophosphorylase/glucosamine-1-phosphate N-acetyltransferase
LQARVLAHHALAGVTFESPATTLCEVGVEIAPDAVIEPNVVLRGRTRVGAGARVGAGSVLVDATLAEGAEVLPLSHVEGAEVGPAAHAGPFARLRPGARLERGAKVGNFVEIKATTLGPGAKVPHLSYVGDALVGARANVGAGTITCNYDGFAKHRTEIGAGAFIGSNSALVAPVRVGAGAIVGAGSVITREVPPDAIAVARGEQRVVDGGAARFRARKAPVTGEGR